MKPSGTNWKHALMVPGLVLILSVAPALGKQDLVTDGEALIDAGNLDEAIEWFERAIEEDSENVDARIGLGRAFLQYGEVETALDTLQIALKKSPSHPRANLYNGVGLYRKALIAIDEGKLSGYVASLLSDAKNCLGTAVSGDPKNIEAYQFLGLVYYYQQDFDAAVSTLERGIAVSPEDAFSHFQLGEIYHVQGEHETALPYYQRAVSLHPSYAAAYRKIGICNEFLARFDEAEEAYRNAIVAAPDYLDPYRDLWRMYGDEGTYGEGVQAMMKLVERLPDHYLVRWYLAHFQARNNENDQAVQSFKRVLELNPAATEAYKELSNLAVAEGDIDTAVAYLKKGLSHEKQAMEGLKLAQSEYFLKMLELSARLGEGRRFEEAEKLMLYLAEEVPNSGFVWNNLGLVYRDWGKYEESLRAYEKAVALEPYDAQIINDYAVVLDYHFERSEEAFEYYRKAVEISENVDALENLARYYLRAGKFEECIQMADRGLRFEPSRLQLMNYKSQAQDQIKAGGKPKGSVVGDPLSR